MILTGKTIGQLTQLTGITSDTLFPVELSGYTYHIPYSGFSDTYVTGFTYDDANTITLSQSNGQSSGVTLNTFTGLTINGGLSATSISADTYYNLPSFTGNTSGDCITDLWVSNVYGCSPITIHDSVQSVGSTAFGILSTAFGNNTKSIGNYSHSEGQYTISGWKGFSVDDVSNGIIYLNNSYGDVTSEFTSGVLITEGYGKINYQNAIYTGSSTEIILYDRSIGGGFSYVSDETNLDSNYADIIPNMSASHSEGYLSKSLGVYSHSEGYGTKAYGAYSHAEGKISLSNGQFSHAEGDTTSAYGDSSHSEGRLSKSIGLYSHSQNKDNTSGWIGLSVQTVGGGIITINSNYGDVTNNFGGEGASGELLLYLPINVGNNKILPYYNVTFSSTTHTEIFIYDVSISDGYAVADITDINNLYLFDFVNTINHGNSSHSEGDGTKAIGDSSHSEGYGTRAIGHISHASGNNTKSIGIASHSEGYGTIAGGSNSHAEGRLTFSNGEGSHSEGIYTDAVGDYSHTEGNETTSIGEGSHSEGNSTTTGFRAFVVDSVVDGVIILDSIYGDVVSELDNFYNRVLTSYVDKFYNYNTITFSSGNTRIFLTTTGLTESNGWVVSELNLNSPLANSVLGNYSHAEGSDSKALGNGSHAEGIDTMAIGEYSHAEGAGTIVIGNASHAEGSDTQTLGESSHAEGYQTIAGGGNSHAEGVGTIASGNTSHAEGYYTESFGDFSHAEGQYTIASGNSSHSEGISTTSFGEASHAEGFGTTTSFRGFQVSGNTSGGVFKLSPFYGNVTSAFTTNQYLVISTNGLYANAVPMLIKNLTFSSGQTIITTYKSINYSNPIISSIDNLNDQNANIVLGGFNSHSEGKFTKSIGLVTHSEGSNTNAVGENSHVEGYYTNAFSNASHAEGYQTIAGGTSKWVNIIGSEIAHHSEGSETQSIGSYSHSEGGGTFSIGQGSHSEGISTYSVGDGSHSEGRDTTSGVFVFSVFSANNTTILIDTNVDLSDEIYGFGSLFVKTIPEFPTYISKWMKVTITGTTFYSGTSKFEIMTSTTSLPAISYVFHESNRVPFNGERLSSEYSHSEGYQTTTLGLYSHSEGYETIAGGSNSHAEGRLTFSNGEGSHSEGIYTDAVGDYSHTEGNETTSIGEGSHSEGYQTTTLGIYSHSEGFGTIALGDYQHVSGKFNLTATTEGAFIVGNGDDNLNRRNLLFVGGTGSNGIVNVSGKTITTNLQVTSGASTAGYVLTDSDGTGNVTWSPVSGLTGSVKKYSETLTSPSGGTYTITHSLGTTDIQVSLWLVTTGDLTNARVTNRQTNSVDVVFSTSPGENVRVVIIG